VQKIIEATSANGVTHLLIMEQGTARIQTLEDMEDARIVRWI